MTSLIFACIAPHGSEIIAELAGNNAPQTATTRAAMEELGRRMSNANPDTIVLLTPHGVRVTNAVCVMTTEQAFGILEGEQGQGRVEVKMPVDTELAHLIADHAAHAHNVPTATAIYGASGGDGCFTPLDWGAVVPLWFLGARWPTPPSIVSITPSRTLTLDQLYNFGTAIAEAATQLGRHVALVASADWGHAHAEDGPYGLDPASAEFDTMIQSIIKANNLDTLLTTDLDFADRAKVDGLWQTIILAGALHHTPMQGQLLSYQAPTYFGMLVAAYHPVNDSR